MRIAIIQLGQAVMATGADLHEAHETAVDLGFSIPRYEDIERLEMVRSPVEGEVYWTDSPSA